MKYGQERKGTRSFLLKNLDTIGKFHHEVGFVYERELLVIWIHQLPC